MLFFSYLFYNSCPKIPKLYHHPGGRKKSSGKANSSGWIRRAIWKNLLESHIEQCHSRAWRVYHPWRAHHRSSSLKWKLAGGFLKWWYPQIIHFNWVFHYKPSILGYPYFWKPPAGDWITHLKNTIIKFGSSSPGAEVKKYVKPPPRKGLCLWVCCDS